ncbi:DUF1351 domain-containing protein [Ligilactobacillus murinus]|uniref:DUF1351 domain-containing protein n=1 Tax=Ligilactobacillus murinus TaxID=1622 RepID=UPI00096C0C36|nr:DUF1351 domain-containing protein [Ligilactobacillus murinus]ASD50600.1 hypothetical protein [Lactobacillus phage phiEF-1.1]
MNELAILDNLVVVQPGQLTIQNKPALDALINEVATKYDGQIVTEDTLKEAKSSRTELNKYAKALDRKRIDKKKEYMKPVEDFEKEVKGYVSTIKKQVSMLDEGIQYFKDKQLEERKAKVQEMIKEVSEANAVDPATVELQNSWLLKSATKAKTMAEIVEAVQKQKRINKDIEMITEYCAKLNLPTTRYVETARDFDYWEAKRLADTDYEELQARKEAERAAKLAKVAQEKEKIVEVGEKQIDSETGEVVKELQVLTLKIKGTKEQLDSLGRVITASGIEVLEASERETVIERK